MENPHFSTHLPCMMIWESRSLKVVEFNFMVDGLWSVKYSCKRKALVYEVVFRYEIILMLNIVKVLAQSRHRG